VSDPRKSRALVKEASQAHCDLNIFYAVIAILEGGTLSAERHDAVRRIITICKSESAKCLTKFDRTTAKIVEQIP
jgi:hypothetical protein